MLKISGLKLPLSYTAAELRQAAAKKLRVPESALGEVRLARRSVDARRKEDVHFVCTVETALDGEKRLLSRLRDSSVSAAVPFRYEAPKIQEIRQKPVVIGLGPAGLFAALILARAGACPLVLERGLPVGERARSVAVFRASGVLDPESNIQFGEGGAGAFSDGKLTTGTGDGRIRLVLEELAAHGAPRSILTDAKPHIGTDRLPGVVQAIREEIVALGGEVRFSAKVCGLSSMDGQLTGVRLASGEVLPCSQAILAVGHSAREMFSLLESMGVPLQAKAFSVGARIEHPAALINAAQYGKFAGHPALGAADYKLSTHLADGRGVYTFCMCPGGIVTPAASEEGGVVTNGASPWARDGVNSNAALLVGVTPEDFGGEGPLAGVEFQRRMEQAAFRLGGGGYAAPAQRVADLLEGWASSGFGGVRPSYEPGVVPTDLGGCLPGFVLESMRAALPILGRQLRGFDHGDAVLTGPETRSSSPVRILRGEDLQCPTLRGLYPCGEGAGYAGGIVSAAVDGIKCAEAAAAAAALDA